MRHKKDFNSFSLWVRITLFGVDFVFLTVQTPVQKTK